SRTTGVQEMRFVQEAKASTVTQTNHAISTSPPEHAQDGLTDIDGVARSLGVSKRYVHTLIQRKVIPVIRLGRRCTRFDLNRVLAAIKKFEVIEVGRK